MGYLVRLLSDHRPLVWLFTAKGINSRNLRWQTAIADFDLAVNYTPWRLNIVADAFSRIWRADLPTNEFIVTAKTTEYLKGFTTIEPKIPRLRVPIKEFWLLTDELLYYSRRNVYQNSRLVCPEGAKTATLRTSHCLPMAGHIGVQVTLYGLQKFAF
ncbi:uncharacterized protein LOC143018114 [Oratosquilla oratoria]|uniref:uncharacterized protein LOC143018114 n=1 Tax=Oratosquilla oratoria TaxID=337810 RepID=UPI003F76464E